MLVSNKNFITEYFNEPTKSNEREKDFEVGIKKFQFCFPLLMEHVTQCDALWLSRKLQVINCLH
jgi:hypothetical protein